LKKRKCKSSNKLFLALAAVLGSLVPEIGGDHIGCMRAMLRQSGKAVEVRHSRRRILKLRHFLPYCFKGSSQPRLHLPNVCDIENPIAS
jgi:hypothetical protein